MCFRCDGKRSCDIEVNSGVFGDPCPNTHKYVEVHYACSPNGAASLAGGAGGSPDDSTRKLPPWLLETGTHLWNTDPESNDGQLVDPNTGIPIQIDQEDISHGGDKNSGEVTSDENDAIKKQREPPTLISGIQVLFTY